MGEQKKEKKELMEELSSIDKQSETRELLAEEWSHRYNVERQLEKLYLEEEIYWRQRVDKQWLTTGDTNTKFFH